MSPKTASTAPVTATDTFVHGHASTCRRASTDVDTIRVVERQLVSSGAAFEERVGYSRAVRVGDQVWVSGTAPIMPGDADPPDDAYEQARVCLGIIERALGEAGASLDHVVRTRIYVTRAGLIDDVGRAHRAGVRHGPSGDDRHRHRAARPALARRDRGGGGDRVSEATCASVMDHRFGSGDPYTLGVEEEFMLLDPETWDLVQHIEAVLAKAAEGEYAERVHSELMQSVVEITTPVCRTPAEAGEQLRQLRAHVPRSPAARAAATRRPGRIPSASSSASASRRRTATGGSSSRCSTSPAAS